MARYLLIGSYTADGAKGLLKEGGTARKKVANDLVASAGGRLESFDWGFGHDDFYVLADLPTADAAAAVALTLSAAGSVTVKTVVLITAEELDRASKISVAYRPPGH